MNKRTAAALLLLTSMIFLTGCGHKTEVITIDDKQYVKNGDSSYTEIGTEVKTFEPGQHFIYYNQNVPYELAKRKDGWGVAPLNVPSTPNGYRYENSSSIDLGGHGYTTNIVHVFVNEVPVEAKLVYNAETDTIGYFEPGTPVKKLVLGE